MTTAIRKLTTLAGALALIVALVTVGLTTSSLAPAGAATGACTTSNLVVWLNTQGNGAAGSSFFYLEFTNLGPSACILQGYPGVSAVTTAGIQLGSSATRDAVHASTPITLQSAAGTNGLHLAQSRTTATVVLQITDVFNYPAARCKPVVAAGLRVYPPNQKLSTVISYPFAACSKVGAGFLGVTVAQKYNPTDG